MPNRLSREGPPLAAVLRRLADTPEDFLAEPRIGTEGTVHVDAVVGDLLTTRGVGVSVHDLERFTGKGAADRNALAVTLLLCWVVADPWFATASPTKAELLGLFERGATELAATPARKFIDDPDRREELVRVTLAAIGFRPAGESQAQAEDRLTSLSSAERARVVEAARTAELRARKIREALKKKAAEESADKWTRE